MKKIAVILIVLFLTSVAIAIWWKNALSPVNPRDKSEKIFVIAKGQGIRAISNKLKEEHLIKDPVAFFILVKKLQIEGKIQAGDFRLSPSQSSEKIALELTHGTLDIWITIPEGQRSGEIADTLKNKLSSYKSSWKNSLVLNEGYLFPDTYLIPKDADIDFIISIMKSNFTGKFARINNPSNLSQKNIVIIASLIEREAKHAADRPLVSSVIHNRLELGMPLQIDATVQFLLGYQPQEKTWWKKNLTQEDLKVESNYNTYLTVGLPPGPIANPGLSTLEASANPAQTDYLYYISDKQGKNHYAKTLDGHNENIKRYGL